MMDAIERRVSVRSYEKRPLSYEDEITVRGILEDAEKKAGPFGHTVRFFDSVNKTEDGAAIGAHGSIKHPPMYMGGLVKNTFEGMVDYGFLFEEVILRVTEAAIGTVWLGGPFDGGDFDVKNHWHEVIPAVSPVGYPAKASMRETLEHGVGGARRRKPMDEVFFMGERLDPLPTDHKHIRHLKAVQAAPSAANRQPWRIVLKEGVFHLFLHRDVKYSGDTAMDIQAIDAGIALSHLHLALREDGWETTFTSEKPFDLGGSEYVLSLKASRPDA